MKDTLQVVQRTDLDQDSIECLWIEILLSRSNGILFGAFCSPPNGLSEFNDLFQESLETASVDNKELIFNGRF